MSETNQQADGSPQASPWAQALPQAPQLGGLPQTAQQTHDIHAQAVLHYNQLKKTWSQLNALRQGMDRLAKLADTVTSEDVVDEAAKLLPKGFSSQVLASMLADMPADGGQALAGWIAQKDAQAQANEQKIKPALDAARQQMGVSALHSILSHQIGQGSAAPTANPLVGAVAPQGA